ncbi:hypothetical protein LTS18_000702, partial [Coniosporium uncinatum]
MGYLHFASIAAGRFGMTQFACDIGDIAECLFEIFPDDHYTIGRGHTLLALFIGHLKTHIGAQIPVLQKAMEATVLSGDRILSILNLGICAAFKVWTSHDLSEVEAFVNEAPMEFQNWQQDLRGG